MIPDIRQRLFERLALSVVPPPSLDLLEKHEIYLSLLAKWTRTINLTAFQLDPPTDEAIDRLLVEPIAASRFAGSVERIVDIGTGGGSPAIPFWVQIPGSPHLTMIESRARKCAFLREAVRQIGPGKGTALDVRFEEVLTKHPELVGSADLVTLRAVRLDAPTVELVSALLKPEGRVFRFTSTEEASVPSGATLVAVHPLTKGTNSILQVLGCSTWNNS